MKLSELYDDMAAGELHLLFDAEHRDADGCILPKSLERMWPNVRLGLSELHKRFLLREGRLTVAVQEDRLKYPLTMTHSLANTASMDPDKFIIDTDAPFQDDLLRIERVYDEEGEEFAINDYDDEDSLFTNDYKTLVIPDDIEATELTVVYRATHPAVEDYIAKASPVSVSLEIPPSHVLALQLFVASRMLNPIGGQGDFHEGNNYAAKFEAEVLSLKNNNYELNQRGNLNRVARKGFP